MHICPVCAYNQLPFPPSDYRICPCCGTEFEADDVDFTHEELRERWILAGMPWFSRHTPPPPGWSAPRQLAHAGLQSIPVSGVGTSIE
jgi:hypothetical protein